MTLVLTALAVFWVWEFLLPLIPNRVPPLLLPLVVAGLGYLATLVPADWLFPFAVAGAVGLLHVFTKSEGLAPVSGFQLPRRQRRRTEVGTRIPDIP